MIKDFLEQLRTQRWDDHRYYHHSRINQSLHFVSALSFLFAYVMLFFDPVISGLVGWLVSMSTRQAGHFFFEPKGYDHVNQATHEYKEEIKVGYNLQRKVVLMAIWALSPLVLFADPTLFGLFKPWTGAVDFRWEPMANASCSLSACKKNQGMPNGFNVRSGLRPLRMI